MLTVGDVAARLGVREWQVRALFERRLLAEPQRLGHVRAFNEDDLPRVAAALRDAGYLPRLTGAAQPAITGAADA